MTRPANRPPSPFVKSPASDPYIELNFTYLTMSGADFTNITVTYPPITNDTAQPNTLIPFLLFCLSTVTARPNRPAERTR